MKKLIVALVIALSTLGFSQGYNFSQNFTAPDSTHYTDSLWIPSGYSPVSISSANLVAGTSLNILIGNAVNKTTAPSSWRWVGTVSDTTLYTIPVSQDSTVITILNPVITAMFPGEYDGYSIYEDGTWIKFYVTTVQDNVAAVFKVDFRKL